jgi:MoCo/4Fe-4S cofactor protein with predicted Tat translocation signal
MNPRKDLGTELAALQTSLDSAHGKKYWRTLEELADSAAFQEVMCREFPEQASVWPEQLSRRRFLALMGASLGLAGVGGCSVQPAPSVDLVPYVRPPEEIVPGRPLFYATAMTLGGVGTGLLVESHLGRPTKIEGNPEHPASLGATDLFQQASILTFYDPDRSQTVTYLGQTRTWDNAVAALRAPLVGQRARRGAGLRVLSETVVSPTLGRQIDELRRAYPEMKWHQYEPGARDAAHRAAVQAYGEPLTTYYDFAQADVVLSLDVDFLAYGPGCLRYTADFMKRRRVRTTTAASAQADMNRLYVVETAVTSTGAKADHRLALAGSEIEKFARALGARLGVIGEALTHSQQGWLDAVARDLEGHRGRCVIIAGERQPAAVHLLVHALNDRLGNVGKTVLHTAPIEARPADQLASLRELVDDMDEGRVELLLIVGGNPVFTAPADFRFAERLQKVAHRFHLSLYLDETSRQCHWHLPEAHYLEAWSDTRAYDGTASIVQPLIEPLYQGHSVHELLSAVNDGYTLPGYEIVRNHWRRTHQGQGGDFESFWRRSVHDGIVANTKLAPRSPSLQNGWERHLGVPAAAPTSGYELALQLDPTIHDGRFANNGWLQELPKPITTLTWDNAVLMSPATASALGVGLGGYAHGGEHGGYHPDIVELQLGTATVRGPVWIVPGHADGAVTVHLGYGRANAGKVGGTAEERVGFNAYPLRTSERPWFAAGLAIRKTGASQLLACTQQHQLMENRAPVRVGTLDEYRAKPDFATEPEREDQRAAFASGGRAPLTMYAPQPYPGHRWGMVIDLTSCTGCKACVVACQAENNIPVVGKDQVAAGREMHWLRVDRYSTGTFAAPTEFHFQPVPCMHCENAPCEYVCPVEATVHSADGLNDMIYQRCVGTRFCSNNCPYKVRRFNFFHYADFNTPSVRLQYNPDVTVRSRGVMEKCSYCVQRIRHADIDAQVQHRPYVDGDILTACQAACPAQAIVFGDLNQERSKVSQWKGSPLNYELLGDLNTHPRTTYLAALRNPNPDLAEAQ